MRADLHIHTTASDGSISAAAVVDRARAVGLDLIAITDHDTIAGVPEAVAAADGRLRVIPAIEISARSGPRDIHVLGYFIDPAHPGIGQYCARARVGRELRLREMIARLARLDVPVAWDAVLAEAGAGSHSLARPHLARALLAAGHVTSVSEAFDRFIGDEGPAYVAHDLLDVAGAINLIHDAGGLAVWAHPPPTLLGKPLTEFVAAGLDGLECHRPRLASPDLNRLLNKARAHDLLVTGGSDWHGDWQAELGTFHLGRAEIGPFLERAGI